MLEPEFFRQCIASGDMEAAVIAPRPPALTAALAKFISSDATCEQLKKEITYIAMFTQEKDLNVLITGETGTGKELLAAALGSCSQGNFVAINCAALPADLIESELFGHVRGAFTGAQDDKRGLIQAAQNGTVFLDEIGDMPLSAQAKLLRVMSTRKLRKVGATNDEPFTMNCRFIGATHRDLLALAALGQFREDLYWRLAQWTLRIPPLRERAADALAIVQSITGWNELTESELTSLTATQTWTGNVRELHAHCTQLILRSRINRYYAAYAAHKAAMPKRNAFQ